MRFSQTFIDDLKHGTDIVRVIQDYVALKKKGVNWTACCPFHHEKTPSFSVSPAKEIYYCFGCQKGGSVFSFVMEMERVNFPEAVKIVAQKTGTALPVAEAGGRSDSRRREVDEIIEMNSWALEWWEAQLGGSGREGRAASEYLKKRGISEETQRIFRLGYAPDSWDALSIYLKGRGASQEKIERSGLVVKRDAGGSYDRFRGRLIFPVMDSQGRPVAFGGRAPRPDVEPKYLNSPETAAYVKGRHLYGLSVTRDEVRRSKLAVLVEGYFDLLIPYQFGVRNIVASLGTALTAEQSRLLGRFTRKIVVNYDGDRAGVSAARRSMETLLAEGFEIRVLVLPNNTDPDEFIRSNGIEAYNERRVKALAHIQFVIDQAVRDRDLLRPVEKADAVEEVMPFLSAVKNGIQKREYFDMAMDALRIEEPLLRRDLWQTVRKGGSADLKGIRGKFTHASGVQPTIAEHRLLELLFTDRELRDVILPLIEPADYEDLPTAAIFRALIQVQNEGNVVDFESLSVKTDGDSVASDLLPLLLMSEPERAEDEALDHLQSTAESCLTALRLMRIDRRINELAAKIAEAERAGDVELSNRLVLDQLNCARQRKTLMPRAEAVLPGFSV